MNATNALIDRVKVKHALKSDYALAKLLGVSTQRITNYRSMRTSMDDPTALQVAQLAGEPVAAVLAELAAERSKSETIRRVYLRMAKLCREYPQAA